LNSFAPCNYIKAETLLHGPSIYYPDFTFIIALIKIPPKIENSNESEFPNVISIPLYDPHLKLQGLVLFSLCRYHFADVP
jgi:hypothetical protein